MKSTKKKNQTAKAKTGNPKIRKTEERREWVNSPKNRGRQKNAILSDLENRTCVKRYLAVAWRAKMPVRNKSCIGAFFSRNKSSYRKTIYIKDKKRCPSDREEHLWEMRTTQFI